MKILSICIHQFLKLNLDKLSVFVSVGAVCRLYSKNSYPLENFMCLSEITFSSLNK